MLRNKGRVPARFDFKAPVGKELCKADVSLYR
jgi:hypothetical protein